MRRNSLVNCCNLADAVADAVDAVAGIAGVVDVEVGTVVVDSLQFES